MISLALSAGFAVEDTCAVNACHAAVYSKVTVHAGKVSHMAQMTTLCHRRCTNIYSYSCAMALLSTTLYLSDPDTRELWCYVYSGSTTCNLMMMNATASARHVAAVVSLPCLY